MQNNMPPQMPPQMGRPRIQPELKDTQALDCPCGHKVFQEGLLLRTLSKILTGESRDTLITVPILYCSKCGEVLQRMLPEELRDNKIVQS